MRTLTPGGLVGLAIAFASAAVFAESNTSLRTQWIAGRCIHCQTARNLSDIQLVGRREAWAVGFNPPGETGEGDATILHSRDGGRTWRELGYTYEHSGEPSFSFVSSSEGWIMYVDMSRAEVVLQETRDTGRHWRRLALHDLFVTTIQDVGHGVGYAASYDIYKKQSYLYATRDDGRSWRQTTLTLDRIDQLAFADSVHGLVAGCLKNEITVLSTDDGGASWSSAILPTRPDRSENGGCAAWVDGLSLSADGQATVLANKHLFGLGDTSSYALAWVSPDGGRTWRQLFRTEQAMSLNTISTLYEGPFQLGAERWLVVDNGAPGQVETSGDGGRSWSTDRIGHSLTGCHIGLGGLACGTERGFGHLLISMPPP